jgi:probable 2-oxoglutarate dehydrogenase E1 component DHKTD1
LYYDLVKEREARSLNDEIAFVRIEELSPFPFAALEKVLSRYTAAREVMWAQEEPRNQGAYAHVRERIGNMLEDGQLKYIGRKESAVPAPGVGRLYQAQQKAVIDQVFDL